MEKESVQIQTRQSLLGRLKDMENNASWQEFFDTYWKLIYNAAIKAGLTDDEAQDVVQETVISVARNIPKFEYDPKIGSFKSWLLKLTRWKIVNQWRKRLPGLESREDIADGSLANPIDQVPDPAGDLLQEFWDEEWEKNVLATAMERAKQQIDPKQYQVFDLYVIQHWPVAKIAETLRMSAARIYLAKHRISRLIQAEVKKLEKKYR